MVLGRKRNRSWSSSSSYDSGSSSSYTSSCSSSDDGGSSRSSRSSSWSRDDDDVRTPNPYSYSRSPSPPARIHSEDENHNGASSSLSKRLKTDHGDVGGDDYGRDRISELPDIVLHHILSFIDMKEVIGNTSLISKRWRNLWMSLPILNFHHYSMTRSKHSFTRFVGRVLLRRDNSVIKSLRICYHPCRYGNCMRSVEDWMVHAARKNVEEVCLDFNVHSKYKVKVLVWQQFSKVQVFKLKARNDLQIPHSLFLDSQLKSLKLDSIKLPEGEVTLSCSSLENLSISYCSYRRVKLLNISAPKLNTLELKNYHRCYNDTCKTCKLHISTPNLTSLLLEGCMYEDYSFENLSSLYKAKIECYEVRNADILRNILEGLHNATTLELCGELQRNYTRSLDMLDHHLLNTFVNLKCLKLIGWSGDLHTIHSLLMNSYSLEAIVLEIDHVLEAHDWRELFPCINCLKSIEIKAIKGCENELKLFEFILKNAVVLEDFTIYSYSSFRRNTREEHAKFNMKIYDLPRASSSVKILAYY